MRNIQYILVILSYILVPSLSFADNTKVQYGLVKEGAFLLSKKPNMLRDNLLVHSLVGYLPTGTRVVVENKQVVTNLNTSNNETYYFVTSELGVKGLIRKDLLIQANSQKLAISVASYKIPIHQPTATLQSPRIRLFLGRYGGNYLEITGESTDGFYDVILHRPNYVSIGLPKTEKGRLKKLYIDKKQVALLDPTDSALKIEFNKSWSSVVSFKEDYFQKLVGKLKDKIDGDYSNIQAILGDINNLQCLIDGSINGELGFKVFSNGFSLGLNAELKKKGIKYIFEGKKLISNSSTKYYSGIGIIKCDGVKPIRLQSFTLQEGVYSGNKRFSIELADLEKSKSKWITTLQGNKISNKMVRISGWNEYNQLIKKLNKYAIDGNGYLSTLPEKTRMVLLNYIVSRIGFFEHRDLIVDKI